MTRPKARAPPARDAEVVADAPTSGPQTAGALPVLQPAAIEAKRKETQTQLVAVEKQVRQHTVSPALVQLRTLPHRLLWSPKWKSIFQPLS